MSGHLLPSAPLLAVRGSNAALVTFLVYTLAVFGIAWASNRLLKSKSFLSEYFLGSRSLGVWAFALTFAATSASGGSFTGFPSKIYSHGWILALWIGSYMVVPICTMGFLGKRINQVARISGAITIPDVLRDRFRSSAFGLLAVSLIVFFMTFNLVAQFKAGSEILGTLLQDVPQFKTAVGWLASAKAGLSWLGLNRVDAGYLLCLLGFAVAVIVYTTWGGFHAVVWTDVMQGFVMVFGVVLMLPLAISAVGGLGNATREMARMTPPQIGLVQFELETPPAENVAVVSPWFALPGPDAERPRLFRVNRTLTFPAGSTSVLHVRVVEITTPEEIDRQLERLRKPAEIEWLNGRMAALQQSRIRWLEREMADGSAETETLQPKLAELRASLAELEQNDIALLPSTVRPTVTLELAYPFGKDREGVYVTGPGPVAPPLPANPGLLVVRVDQPDAVLRVLTSDGRLASMHGIRDSRGAGTALDEIRASLNRGSHTVEIVRAGFRPERRTVTIREGDTAELDVKLQPAADYAQTVPPAVEPAAPINGFLPLSLAISFFFMWSISGTGVPSNMVRLMAFRDARTLRLAIFTVAIYYSLIYLPLVLIFCCARVLLPGMELESDRVMPQMAVTLTNSIGQAWLAGLLIAAPFAAVMSTVDSFLLMISSSLVRDIYQRNLNPAAPERTIKRLSYLCTLMVGAGATLGAVNPPQFLQDIIVYTGSGLAACFLAPVVFALYWPRSNAAGCIAGMLAGFLAHFSMYLAGMSLNGSFFSPWQPYDVDPILVGLAVSFVTTWLVARVTPAPPDDLVRRYFYRSR